MAEVVLTTVAPYSISFENARKVDRVRVFRQAMNFGEPCDVWGYEITTCGSGKYEGVGYASEGEALMGLYDRLAVESLTGTPL